MEGKIDSDDILILQQIEGLPFLGQGNTAEIYDYSKDCIIKLFRDGFPEQGVIKEWTISNRIQEVYEKMPKALKYVVCGDRHGILYEKVSGNDMLSLLKINPFSVFSMGKKIAFIHEEIHKTEIEGILTVKEKLLQEISWAEEPYLERKGKNRKSPGYFAGE